MKKLLLSLLCAFLWTGAFAQDPQINGPSISPAPIPLTSGASNLVTASLTFQNTSTTSIAYLSTNPMYLVVSLNKMAPILQNGVPLVDGAGAQYFTWTYDSENNTIIGIQNQAIPGKPDPFTTVGGVINFYGTVTGEATPDQARAFNGVGFNANINPGFGGNISNQNDAASTYTYTTGSLPVTLMAFSGRYQEGVGNVLSWATASEKNNALFQVERSVDAQRFESIGTVKGKGTTAARSQYTFTDANASAAVTYYRLKQVDLSLIHI